jgi:hypothetical protein
VEGIVNSYILETPRWIVSGVVNTWNKDHYETLDEVREALKGMGRPYRKYAKVFRVTKEEIDITEELW